jgi:ATP/maltotriose-dependent transcriptional regulator MalT
MAYAQDDYPRAAALHAEAAALLRELGMREALAWTLNGLAEARRCQGGYAEATPLYEEALRLFRDLDVPEGIAWAQHNLGQVALQHGDVPRAAALLSESLREFQELQRAGGVAACLGGLAAVVGAQADRMRAARLVGAATHLLETTGAALEPVDRLAFERTRAEVRAALGERAFVLACAEGRALTAEQAVRLALDPSDAPSPSLQVPPDQVRRDAPSRGAQAGLPKPHRSLLSPRELEVLRLVAEGLSNQQIAERLVTEKRTIESHLTHIGKKLLLPRRAVVARAAEMLQAAAAD